MQDLLDQLEQSLNTIQLTANTMRAGKADTIADEANLALNLIEKIRAAAATASQPAVPGTPQPAQDEDSDKTIASFFAQLGQGLIDTQKDLDTASEQYLIATKDKPYIEPTVFRMPKVSGSLKVGLSKTKGTGLNLLVFNNKQEEQNSTEQNISFEMIAAPAPVDAVQKLAAEVPDLSLVLNPKERAYPMLLAQQHLADLAEAMQESTQKALSTPHQVLVFNITGTNRGISWLLLASTTGGNAQNDLGAWLLDEQPAGGAPHLTNLFFQTGMNQNKTARQLFNGLLNKQIKLLTQLG